MSLNRLDVSATNCFVLLSSRTVCEEVVFVRTELEEVSTVHGFTCLRLVVSDTSQSAVDKSFALSVERSYNSERAMPLNTKRERKKKKKVGGVPSSTLYLELSKIKGSSSDAGRLHSPENLATSTENVDFLCLDKSPYDLRVSTNAIGSSTLWGGNKRLSRVAL
jgi:hypothetical protein